MKLRRAITALGMAFALSFGLMLAPSQADAATLTINPRANAVEAGQVLAAPDGSVFTITVYDIGLANGQKSVTHTYVTGNTLRQTANKIVQAINADSDLQAIGVTATLGTGANYTINSTSANGTAYKQVATGGGTNRLAIQQTLTIGGTVTVDDKLTLTIFDAGLVGGKEAVVYRPNTGDTLADIVIRLRNKINNSTTLDALGITAKVSPTDPNTLLIESPTFDATERVTSYSAVVKAGGTETMTLGAYWGTNGAQTLSVTGPVTVGETVKFTVFNLDLPDLQKEIKYEVQPGDNLNKIRCGLRTEVNNDTDLAAVGYHATCSGGVVNVTTESSAIGQYFVKQLIVCAPINNNPTKWPAANQAKICGNSTFSANIVSGLQMRETLEAIGDPNTPPQHVQHAAGLLSSNSTLPFYMFRNHDDFYESGSYAIMIPTGGPTFTAVLGVKNNDWANPPYLAVRSKILGFSVGEPFGYSLLFEDSRDENELGFITNEYIKHATAHEAGHQYSFLAGNLSKSATFQQAWNMDLAGMALAKPCKYEAPVADTDPQQMVTRHGIFSAAVAADGNFICGADGEGDSSSYGGDSLTVLKTAYRFFDQPSVNLDELFPDIFAWRAGFPNYIGNDGNEIFPHEGSENIGSNRVYDTSQALVCSVLYVRTWAEFGRDPSPDELHGVGYSFPAGTQTGTMHCDGSIEYEDNTGT